ncbi:TetR/AcrR family transcriptional regulator [Halomonas huangheensis]|uniref:HTH tetR-type domain-containing protein n=1 Tax=Halomonas huangheensis TaxID=1178482 RepID=W1N940_9GAMM|nr:TetR/AcrR family transcriptional regulator [Halomonas huangheensis]ALM53344.1 hypothetical protein AR456_14470 [Halomonas huangheensis]ERL52009.1 hypothetical protein BJB45_12640 [Halomonas huangheensis]
MKWQQQKSQATREKILRASLICLERDGFHNLSLARVASEADVSKGALTHHFSNKDELITLAMEVLLAEFVETLQVAVNDVHAGRMSVDDCLDEIWRIMSGQLYMVTLEIVLKARHEAEFKSALVPLVRHFHIRLNDIWQQLFPELAPERAQALMNLTMNLLRGMGTQSVFREDRSYFNELLTTWKEILAQQLAR